MSDGEKQKIHSRTRTPDYKIRIVILSGAIGCLAPIVLGVIFGLLFLTSWNIWPAFLIVGAIFGFIIGLLIGVLIAWFSK